MIQLRDYQRAAIDSLYRYWEREKGNPLIVAPCGAGKSLIIAFFIQEAMQWPGTRILVMTHRQELLVQNEAELRGIWPDAPSGFFSAGLRRRDTEAPILFAGIQSVWNKLHLVDPFDLVLIDEAHLVPRSGMTRYGAAIETLRMANPDTRFIGLTATPYRLDSGKLHEGSDSLFDQITYDIPVMDLVKRGHLVEVVGKKSLHSVDMTGVKRRGGEFVEKEMSARFDIEEHVQAACEEIVRYGRDRRAWMVFASSIAHAEHVRDAIRSHGITCKMVTGETPRADREQIIEQFKHGDLRCLVNVDVLTIGFNAPICDLGALLRATASTALYVQIVGRLMRTHPGKENALLLDFGGNVERHGPIDAVEPKSASDGDGEGDAPVKTCPQCQSLVATAAKECPDCGFLFPEPEASHDAEAYFGAVMSHQRKPELVRVDGVKYYRHSKPGKPDSVRVEYRCGLRVYKDWWLPEHTGTARLKTVRRLMDHGVGCPSSTATLLEACPMIPVPSHIEVVPDGKFDRVSRVHFESPEPPAGGQTTMAQMLRDVRSPEQARRVQSP